MAINKVMVLGAGTMGMGIAQVFAEAGKTVIVRDIADAFIQRGEGVLKKNMEKKVAKGKITEEQKNETLGRVSFTLELADAKDCDLVVEAAIEVLDIKKSIFKELDEVCKPETILASNTSSISITAIAAATKRPQQVLGMHFFNPAPAMKLSRSSAAPVPTTRPSRLSMAAPRTWARTPSRSARLPASWSTAS